MAIPAAFMDKRIYKRIDELALIVVELRSQVALIEEQNKNLKKEIEKDVHEHIRALATRIQKLEKELKALK